MDECIQCGKCCHNHSILIMFSDLRRIHFFYPELNLAQYITLYEVPENYKESKLIFENYPSIPMREGSKLYSGYLALRFIRNENVNDKKNIVRRCPFLDPISKNCTIHQHKPLVCRIYPHALNCDDELIWNEARCNEPWYLKHKSTNSLKNLIKEAKNQNNRFKSEVEEWSKIVTAFQLKENINLIDEFLNFIMKPRDYDDFH